MSTYVFGVNPVLEVLRANPASIEKLSVAEGALTQRVAGEILSRAREAKVRVETVDRERLTRMTDGGVHQGVVAQVRDFEYLGLAELIQKAKASGRQPLVVLLDGIQDPHNLGAIARSAYAFGAQGMVIMKDRAVGVTPVAMKASAGALAHLAVARVTNLSRAIEELKEAGFWTVALEPEGKEFAWQAKLTGPLAVIVGAEGAGVRKGVLGHADFKVRIPMSGQVDSLNASVSAGVLLYEIARQRG
ncbi:MAG: 23S rRNA (guanosine(2251)-2'-O)-methyltransferase RlmB [Myxococcota bacterium]